MAQKRPFLERLKLSGYKSIREADLEFTKLNVLIGANGAGKTNLVSFFSFLPAALDGRLDAYVGRHGGPNALLYFGAKRTAKSPWRPPSARRPEPAFCYQRFGFRPPKVSSTPATTPTRRGEWIGRTS